MGKRRSPRIITHVIVFLLLIVGGAIANVAVAWGLVLRVENPIPEPNNPLRVPWPTTVPIQWSDEANLYVRSNWALTEITGYGSLRGPPAAMTMLYLLEAGFPCRALNRTVSQEQHAGTSFARPDQQIPDNWREGVTWPERLSWLDQEYRGVVPVRPIWPGFAINTVFYAAILLMLFAAPFALRRRRRIKRGLCPACAYPVGESEVCTECGGPVSGRT